jgi:signal transduction histidine kinase
MTLLRKAALLETYCCLFLCVFLFDSLFVLSLRTHRHEVRNPLSASMSACAFVASFLDDKQAIATEKGRQLAREDIAIVDSCLHYINDLLRNMLDLHRASSGQMQLKESAISVLDDVLRPVSNMLYTRGANVQVVIDCPDNLVIESDRLRLTQIVL